MSNKRRVAETNFGLFSNGPADGSGGFLVPMDNLNVGPGEPGPGDEWHVPTGPVTNDDDATLESRDPKGAAALPQRPSHKE